MEGEAEGETGQAGGRTRTPEQRGSKKEKKKKKKTVGRCTGRRAQMEMKVRLPAETRSRISWRNEGIGEKDTVGGVRCGGAGP